MYIGWIHFECERNGVRARRLLPRHVHPSVPACQPSCHHQHITLHISPLMDTTHMPAGTCEPRRRVSEDECHIEVRRVCRESDHPFDCTVVIVCEKEVIPAGEHAPRVHSFGISGHHQTPPLDALHKSQSVRGQFRYGNWQTNKQINVQ